MSATEYQAKEDDRQATEFAFELQAVRARIANLRDGALLRLMRETLTLAERITA